MLKQKMLRDMKQNKLQFLSIMLMAFLGIFIFTGIGGEWAGVESYREKYYQKTNLADGWIWGDDFSDDDLDKVKNIEGIESAQKRCYLEVTGEDSHNPTVYLYALNENSINKPYIAEGSDIEVYSSGKVWLDKRFADARNLKVGDSYTFIFDKIPFTLQIAGLVYSSEYQYYANENDLWPDFNNIGFAYCSYKSLPMKDYIINYIRSSEKSVEELVDEFSAQSAEIAENANLIKGFSKEFVIKMLNRVDESEFYGFLPYTQIVFTSTANASDLSDEIDSTLAGNYLVYTTRAETEGIFMLDNEMDQHKMMGSIFPVVFLLIAVLAIVTSMNRLVNNQRIQIGTLKALGFSKNKIIFHYVNYGFWVSLIGAVLGLIVGPFVLPKLFYDSLSGFYTLPEWKAGWDISFVIVAVAIVLLCTLVTFFTVRGMLSDSPAETLRPKAPKKFKLSKIEKSSFWRKLNFSFRWCIRTFIRGKVRTIMAIIGTTGCMMLLICAFSMSNCMDDMKTWMYSEIQVQQTRFTLDSTADITDAENIADDVDGELIMTSAIEIRANGVKKTYTATVTDGEGCFYVTDTNRNQITPDDNMIAVSKKAADVFSLKEGDEFEWHIYASDEWVKSKVTIINRTPISQGIVLTRNTFENLGYTFAPNYVDTLQKVSDYKNEMVVKVLTEDDLLSFWNNYMESMNLMVGVLILFAVILALVVLYNLGQLNMTEKERENATLKVIGFSTGRILNLNLLQNLICSVISVILGVPCGLYLVYFMIKTAGDEFDIMINLSVTSFLICAAITVGVSVLVNLLFRKHIKKLDMVTSLKGVE
ncbi:MAG: ABC transporter permease [Eubacterium sp.]|nr:ABC transporter permease [Eubacterium sp.]